MADTPRKRLSKLLDDLELPKGFRLTPVRESCLRKLGEHMLKEGGQMWVYGPKVNWRNLSGRWHMDMTRPERAALRGMGKAAWVRAMPEDPHPLRNQRWSKHNLVWQAGIAQLAKRLGARRILWEERKQVVLATVQGSYEELRQKLYEARRSINTMTNNGRAGENDVLEVYRKVRQLTSSCAEAEQRLAVTREALTAVPEPTEDEAFAWLMERELKGGGT